MPLFALIALSGCRNEYSTFRPALDLVVTLEDPTPTAGDEVAYLAYMDGASEPVALDDELMLSSDLEQLLDWGDGTLIPTIAGPHELTASTMFEGELYVVSVDMAVSPGPPALVDLQLEDLQTDAGVPIQFGVLAWDEFGNETPTVGIDVSLSSTDVSIDGNTFYSEKSGLYTATAADENVSDVEDFVVVAGPPAGLDLELSRTELEVAETALATVRIVDEFGNLAGDEPWDLWVDPATDVVLNYNAITFDAEGWYTVYAATLDGGLSDSVGPFLIDSTGPELDVLVPERGTQTTDAGQYVGGTVVEEWSGVTGITVNGDSATLNSDGTWESWQDYDFGMTALETVAVDGDGNRTTDTRAVLSGEYNSYGYGIGDGLQVRITEDGFDTLEELAVDFIDTDLLASSIPNPVFEDSAESCVWSICWTWYSVTFTVTNPSISSTGLDIDPTSGGYLDTEAVIYDPHLDFNASGKVLFVSYSQSGSIDADWISVAMEMTPYVSAGQLGVTVANVETDEDGFDFDLDGWLWDVIDFFGIPVDSLIWSVLGGLLEDMAEDEIPDLFADAVQDLELGTSLDLEDNTYELDAIPYSVSVDDAGMTLGLETYFTAVAWMSPFTDTPGSLVYPYTAPTYSGASNAMILGLSQDFLNQLFHALWVGGLLDMQMPADELGLDLGEFGEFLPFSELGIGTVAYLPPVVIPGTGSELLDLQLGDLEVSLYDGDNVESNLWMRFYVTIDVGFELGAEEGTLNAGLGDTEILFDLVYPNERSIHADGVESFLGTLVDLLLPTLTGALGEFPIPELDGFTLDNITIELDGAEDGFVTLGGDLNAD